MVSIACAKQTLWEIGNTSNYRASKTILIVLVRLSYSYMNDDNICSLTRSYSHCQWRNYVKTICASQKCTFSGQWGYACVRVCFVCGVVWIWRGHRTQHAPEVLWNLQAHVVCYLLTSWWILWYFEQVSVPSMRSLHIPALMMIPKSQFLSESRSVVLLILIQIFSEP